MLSVTPVVFKGQVQMWNKACRNIHRLKSLTAQTSVLTSVQTPDITIAAVHSVHLILSVCLCVPLSTVVSALLHCERSLQLCPPACWVTQCCGSAVWAPRAPSSTGCHYAADRTQFTLTPAHLSCCHQPQLEDTNYTTLLFFLLFFHKLKWNNFTHKIIISLRVQISWKPC